MNKSEEIKALSEDILIDISNEKRPLHIILLRASRLSLLLDMPGNVELFKNWAKYAEQNQFIVASFQANIASASSQSNGFERSGIRQTANQVVGYLATYRTETYKFVMSIHTKWKFGDVAESIFEKKRRRAELILKDIFPDVNQRLNSISNNVLSENSEDWKSAVVSCRTLLMDIADILNPAKTPEEKPQYINRLKSFISPKSSTTKESLVMAHLEDLKDRIEYTSNLTQGGAHQDRPEKVLAEDVVLYTYLILADLMNIYSERNPKVDHTIGETAPSQAS